MPAEINRSMYLLSALRQLKCGKCKLNTSCGHFGVKLRVIVVEDNPGLARLLAERLQVRGLNCDIAGSLDEARTLLTVSSFDAILLDLGLPDGDGLDLLKGFGADRPPVLVLTARGSLQERISGLNAGADDYLVKPADAEEIAARLRALMRRPGLRQSVTLEHLGILFDTVSREAHFSGKDLNIGAKEADLLELLLRSAGKVVPRERVEAALYGASDAVTPNALEAVASRLRKRLTDAAGQELLHTVRGVGYYLGTKKQ